MDTNVSDKIFRVLHTAINIFYKLSNNEDLTETEQIILKNINNLKNVIQLYIQLVTLQNKKDNIPEEILQILNKLNE